MEPIERHFLGLSPAGFHDAVYWDWPATFADARTLIAVHGLTRNGRDFDAIAERLCERRRIVCPDVVGRGKSGWLPDGSLYAYPQYLADANVLIARLAAESIDWLGTSMGGLIGMMLAAQPRTPIRRLIVNDVGPFIPKAALERIGTYVGRQVRFDNIDDLESHLRLIHAGFGKLSDADWANMAHHSARALPDGGFALAYDPAIGAAFSGPITNVDLWPVWDMINCPVLIIRGAESDLLLAATAAEMVRRKPNATLVEFQGCGHAPALMDEAQIGTVQDWLDLAL